MSNSTQMLHLSITQYGTEEEGRIGLVLEGFTMQAQVDYVLERFNKFMKDGATEVKQ